MTFTPSDRLTLINVLPQEVGSLRESVRIKRLRDKVQFTEEEQDTLDIDERGSFDPTALDELDDVEMDLTDKERDVIAMALVKKEQDGEVPTSDGFVKLVEEFSDEIASAKEDLDQDE